MGRQRRDYVIRITADDGEFLRALRRIDQNVDKMANDANRSFRGIGEELNRNVGGGVRGVEQELGRLGRTFSVTGAASATAIGASVAAFIALKDIIARVAGDAARLFRDIVAESTNVAKGFESVERSFRTIFDNNEQVAEDAFAFIRAESERLGVDLTKTARRLLPQVGSLEEAAGIGELAAGLVRLEPEQRIQGALIALNEALAGELRSLRFRFEIPTARIGQLQDELGNVQGLIEGLGEVLAERGVDFDTFEDTAITAFDRITTRILFLKGILGEPILEEFKAGFQDLNVFLEENSEIIDDIVELIGKIVAEFVEFGLDEVFKALQEVDLEVLKEELAEILATVELALEALSGFELADLFEQFGLAAPEISTFNERVEEAGNVVLRFAKFLFDTGKVLDAFVQSVRAIKDIDFSADPFVTPLGQEIGAGGFDITKLTEIPEVFGETWERTMEEADEDWQRFVDRVQSRRDEILEDLSPDRQPDDRSLELADATLALNLAEKEADAIRDELAESTEKLTEKEDDRIAAVEKAERALLDSIMDAGIKRQRALVKLEEDTANKRLDAFRKNEDKIEDIFRKNQQDLEDAAIEFQERREDVERRHRRAIEDVERESNQERIRIEEDFRLRLAEIRRRFDFEAEEAIRQNDAVALLRIRRREAFEIEEAKKAKEESIDEENRSAKERRAEAKRNLDQELEDLKINERRKLEEIQRGLERRLEQQSIALARELEQIAINEARKREEIERSFDEQIEDLNRQHERRLRELQIAADREIAQLKANEERILATLEATNRRIDALRAQRAALMASMTALGRSSILGGARGDPGERSAPTGRPGIQILGFIEPTPARDLPGGNLPGRQSGGGVLPGQDVVVGESGPETVRFTPSGRDERTFVNQVTSGADSQRLTERLTERFTEGGTERVETAAPVGVNRTSFVERVMATVGPQSSELTRHLTERFTEGGTERVEHDRSDSVERLVTHLMDNNMPVESLLALARLPGRQFGGGVLPGIDYVVGERGAEVVRFPAIGRVIPNINHMQFNPAPTAGHQVNQTSIDRSMSNQFMLTDPSRLSPVQRAEITAIITDMMLRASR